MTFLSLHTAFGALQISVLLLQLDSVLSAMGIASLQYLFYFFYTSAYLSCQNKKRKMDSECHAFKAHWSVYYFAELESKTFFYYAVTL